MKILAAPVYKTDINGRGDPLRSTRGTLYPQKLALNSLISGLRSVDIVRLRTKSHGVCFSKVIQIEKRLDHFFSAYYIYFIESV
jgi:hypothetical protein